VCKERFLAPYGLVLEPAANLPGSPSQLLTVPVFVPTTCLNGVKPGKYWAVTTAGFLSQLKPVSTPEGVPYLVCKTFMHRFESDRRLFSLFNLRTVLKPDFRRCGDFRVGLQFSQRLALLISCKSASN
jgi:hypothetical protein